MDFLTAQQELSERLGLDLTQTDTATRMKRYLNLAYKDIGGDYVWSWLEDTERVTVEVDYTTGTVSATAGSGTITFSATIATSQVDKYIQFSSTDDWYKITAHTAGTATATIDPVYAQSTNLTSGTFTIRKIYYSLSSSVQHVYNTVVSRNKYRLKVITPDYNDRIDPFSDSTGDPRAIYYWGQDSNNNWIFVPYPTPDEALILEFKIIKRITELSGDTDTPLFPSRFDSVWIDGALRFGYSLLDDDREKQKLKEFQNAIKKLKIDDSVSMKTDTVRESIDEGADYFPRRVGFPSNFGRCDGW